MMDILSMQPAPLPPALAGSAVYARKEKKKKDATNITLVDSGFVTLLLTLTVSQKKMVKKHRSST